MALYQEVMLKMDQECVELFEKEAARRNMSLSTFLQDAGLLCVAQEDAPPPSAGEKPRRKKKKLSPG